MKLTYISILHSLSILVVVFFHVYQYMYVPAHFPETVQMYHDAYFWFNQCVGINIAMPMFTLIAGFLFSYFYDKGKYQEFVPLIKKKAMRLLLPFFVFGILMMATTGVSFRPWELYTGGFAHLWYLSFLFWCFPLGWFIKEPTLKSKACLKCLYFTKIISDLCRYLEYFSYLYTINQTE